MCGILGGNNKNWDYEKGIKSIHHRGPDMSRIVECGNLIMCFARLSIIDISENGMQPMFSEDGRVALVFNGEIYGYQQLRQQLEKKYQFHSESDTEVVLNMYLEYGEKFIDKIDGIFAIAICDLRDNRLRLYRDRIGVKPLYYYLSGKDFLFSSEIKGITSSLKNVDLSIDNTALYDYITYSYIPIPKTMYKNIYKLEPATLLVYNLDTLSIERKEQHWEFKINPYDDGKENIDECAEKLRIILGESVKDQLIADVPVGVMTSGGVDSSIITYLCASINPQIETFTIKNLDKYQDESKFAKILTSMLGLKENVIPFGIDELRDVYEKSVQWFDEPAADRSSFMSYCLAKEAKKRVTVLLSGDGADELFAGYKWLFSLQDRESNNNATISKEYEKWSEGLCFDSSIKEGSKLDSQYLDDISFYCKKHSMMLKREKRAYRERWGIPEDYDDYWYIKKFYNPELPSVTRLQFVEFNTYLPYILAKVDATSMANSLEVRVPFLSRKVVEYAFSLSQKARCCGNLPKEVLKRAFPEIPRELMYRKKIGFDVPENYFGVGMRSQELMLKQLWGL